MENSCPADIAEIYNYIPLQALHWCHLSFSVASIIIVIYIIIGHLHKSWFEGVFKETVYALHFFILWHSIFTTIFAGIHIVPYLTAEDPCDMLINMKFCVIRIIITLSFPSFVFLHTAVTLQRVITTFSGSRLLHLIIGRIFLILIFAQCLVYLHFGFHGYPLEGRTALCPGYIKGKEEGLLFGTFVMMSIDFVNVVVGILLMVYNRRKVQQLSSSPLQVKFRYRQTLQSIQQMLPSTIFHLLCFTAQYVGFHVSFAQPLPDLQQQTLTGFLYMMPYYCFICPALVLWLTISEEKRKKNELKRISTKVFGATAESHFAALVKQWEGPRPSTSSKEPKNVYKVTRETTE